MDTNIYISNIFVDTFLWALKAWSYLQNWKKNMMFDLLWIIPSLMATILWKYIDFHPFFPYKELFNRETSKRF